MAKGMEETMVRLIWQELKFRRNAIIGWGLGLCFFPLVYISIYPSVAEEMQGLADLEIYQAMGISLGTFEDWVASILFLFVPLILGIYAIINGTGTLAAEEEDGRLEMMVTLPLERWQIVTAKAIALSIATMIILLIVSLVSALVLAGILDQVETDMMPLDLTLSMMATWPVVFAVAMLSMFFAAFCSRRRIAGMIMTVILIAGYFGATLIPQAPSLAGLEPIFLFTYLDSTADAVINGQPIGDVLVLLALGLVGFALAVFFFGQRDLTVGMWPWQRAKAEA
jgi:ABC-2 type transport system permease protein